MLQIKTDLYRYVHYTSNVAVCNYQEIIGCDVSFMVVLISERHGGLFLKVGICGGFTTFSSFALETGDLVKNGDVGIAVLYAVLSMVLGVAAVFGGEAVAGGM